MSRPGIEIDRRLVRRRRDVAEGRARSSLWRLGALLLLAAFVGLVVWAFRSPLFALKRIVVEGGLPQLNEEVAAGSGLAVGQPLVTIRPATVEAALAENPQVLTAEVIVDWPDEVRISITPRVPVAWMPADGGWLLVGRDGVALAEAAEPGDGLPRIVAPAGPEQAGGLEFAAEIDPLLFNGASVEVQGSELWATIGGYRVRLGRPIDMAAKAHALNSLLRQNLAPGSEINLIAPARPAITPP